MPLIFKNEGEMAVWIGAVMASIQNNVSVSTAIDRADYVIEEGRKRLPVGLAIANANNVKPFPGQ